MSDEETRALLQKARRYIRSAELLLQDADYDSAASRLYYAMFYCAEAVLLTKGLSYSSHKGVISAFGQHFVKAGTFPPYLHAWLREAFDKRQIGDYESFLVLTKADVEDMLEKARQFVDDIEAHLRHGV